MFDLGLDIESAFNSMGASMYSNDFSAQILSYTFVFGGSNEAVTQNKKLSFAISIAQKKANLYGGEIANNEMMQLIQKYIDECRQGKAGGWIKKICERYDLKWFDFYEQPSPLNTKYHH